MRPLVRGWSLHLALRAGLRLEVVLPRRVLLAVVAVAVLAANSSQVAAPAANSSRAAVPAQPAAALQQPDSRGPERPLPAALVVPQAELVQAKPTRTRLNRDR